MSTRTFLVATLVLAGGIGAAALDNPRISGVSPDPIAPDAKAQVIIVSGAHFLPGVVLDVTSPDGRTTNYAGNAIRDRRDASFGVAVLLDVAGSYSFVATNTDGGSSGAFPVTVKAGSTAPSITRVTPALPPRSREPQVLSVDGTRFMPGLSVTLTDPAGNMTTLEANAISNVTAQSFRVAVTLASSGDYALLVTNPSGDVSNSFGFSVSGQ